MKGLTFAAILCKAWIVDVKWVTLLLIGGVMSGCCPVQIPTSTAIGDIPSFCERANSSISDFEPTNQHGESGSEDKRGRTFSPIPLFGELTTLVRAAARCGLSTSCKYPSRSLTCSEIFHVRIKRSMKETIKDEPRHGQRTCGRPTPGLVCPVSTVRLQGNEIGR